MTNTNLLRAAFAHHVWATAHLLDACRDLSSEQLQHEVAGTRGPIIDTLAHIVDSDAFDLDILEGRNLAQTEETEPEIAALRGTLERNDARWSAFLSRSPDLDAMVTEVDPTDGFRRDASVAMRLLAALDHSTDHRSQINTALTTLGIRPPSTDVMKFGVATGEISETPGKP